MIKRIGVTIPLLFGTVVLSIVGVSAQSLDTAKSEPRSGATVSDRILENYLDLNSASQEQRPEIFSSLSPQARAGVFRFHLAFQLVKRPGLSHEQKELILEAISGIRAESYDRNKPESLARAREVSKLIEQNAMSRLSKKETYEIFASLTADKADAGLIRKYLAITALRTMDERRALFNSSSSVDKSDYWRVHFAYCLARYEFNADQQKIIVDAIDLVKPELYEIGKSHSDRQVKVEMPASDLSRRARVAFSKDIGIDIFLNLGKDRGGPTVELQRKCKCAQDSIPSCWDEICQSDSCSVVPGCGVLWLFDCDGLCPPRPPGSL